MLDAEKSAATFTGSESMEVELTRFESMVLSTIRNWDRGEASRPLTVHGLASLVGCESNRSYLRKSLKKLESSNLVTVGRVKSRGIEVADIRLVGLVIR